MGPQSQFCASKFSGKYGNGQPISDKLLLGGAVRKLLGEPATGDLTLTVNETSHNGHNTPGRQRLDLRANAALRLHHERRDHPGLPVARKSTKDRISSRRDGCPDLRGGTGLHDGDLSHLLLERVLDDEVVFDRPFVLDD